jgi:phosphoribosylaminoimidazolecarboxamide formyltransferase / IMP cyclohydrolase
MRAIISVSDKRGIVELARQLAEIGGADCELYSTGGTKAALAQGGIVVRSISELTNFPEIMDGRVKTLHPAVYSGILARRDKAEHMAALTELGLPTIDLVVVNLYPFVETIRQPDTDIETAIENIDIGGPAMIRAAAKNHESVIVLVDPADYPAVIAELHQGGVSLATRRQLAAKAYQHTASYDTYIAQYLRGVDAPAGQPLPEEFSISLRKLEEMRYGENPHQRAAVYADSLGNPSGTLIGNLRQLNGKQLSYNNILDADAALEIVRDFAAPTVVIIKHNNPCGLASGDDLRDDYARALAGDPVSAFGGIVGVNRPVDDALAEDIAATFYEVVIAPSFSAEAVDTLARKKNLRVLEVGELPAYSDHDRVLQLRQVGGGFLVQDRDVTAESDVPMKIVTAEHPSLEQVNDLLFAWRAVKHVKSNAIVLVSGRAILGIGPGQPNRVDSVRLAVHRAGKRAIGSVLASDAFFPFPDGVEEAAKAGVKAIIQPGGSVRDDEVIAMADQYGVAMVFTGRRHFKH